MDFVRAFSPGHVTGFFSISDQSEDPLRRGSTGAGFCLDLGVTTEIRFQSSKPNGLKINDQETPIPGLISSVLGQFPDLPADGWQISQTTPLPIGCGFGTSGAAALSLSLGLNHFLGEPFTPIEAAQKAHLAELQAKTGLGTVLCETFGGFEIRKTSGGPGLAELDHFPVPSDLCGVYVVFGPYSTESMLSRKDLRSKITQAGNQALQSLGQNPNLTSFLGLCRDFTLATGLLTPRLKDLWNRAEAQGVPVGMLMFGEGLFSLVPKAEALALEKNWKVQAPEAQVFSSKFDFQGGRIVHSH